MNLALSLAVVVFADTWIVDDDGGAGVDFTDIPAAVAAAADGDLLVVHPGSYTHFVLTGKGLCIVGAGSTSVVDRTGAAGQTTVISDVPAGSLAFLSRLTFPGPSLCDDARLLVSGDTTRAMLADIVAVGHMEQCNGTAPALRAVGCDLMLVGSNLTGGPGFRPFPSTGGPGGSALDALGARVWVVRSQVSGGSGVAGNSYAGDGGPGVSADSQSRVWIANSEITGGRGSAALSGDVGIGGPGVIARGAARVRISGDPDDRVSGGHAFLHNGPGIVEQGGRVTVHDVEVWTGETKFGAPPELQTSGFHAAATLPVLAIDGTFMPGSDVTFELRNGPANGAFVMWLEGAEIGPRSGRDATMLGELALRRVSLGRAQLTGTFSAAGTFALTVPASSIVNELHRPCLFQAAALLPDGTLRLSNPMEFALRP